MSRGNKGSLDPLGDSYVGVIKRMILDGDFCGDTALTEVLDPPQPIN